MLGTRSLLTMTGVGLLTVLPPAWGLATDIHRPILLHANAISIDQATGLSHYRGNVVLRQGSLRITADRATAVRNGRTLERVLTYGSPATARQRLEQAPHEIVIRGTNMRYEANVRRILVTGDVTVQRGRDRIRADTLSYDLRAKELNADGGKSHQVEATLWPRKSKP